MHDHFKLADYKERMNHTIEALEREFGGIRAGRAHPSILDSIRVNAYESMTPLSQMATIHAPEPRMLSIQVWDKGLVKNVEKAILESDLGLNPMSEGQVIRINMPNLSEERRKELIKIASKAAETARVSIRNIRRDGMDYLKKLEKDGHFSEDDHHHKSHELQTLTDEYIKKIDTHFEAKEKDILQV